MASQDWFEKDFYAILGVPQDADAATIKKTYRKVARTMHPDHNVGDPKAEERFKEIGEAYAVLSATPRQRREYDAIRAMSHGGARFTAGGPGGQGAGFEDIFSAFGGPGGPGGGSASGSTPAAAAPSPTSRTSSARCSAGGAPGAGYGGYGAPAGPRPGADVQASTRIGFRDAVEGSTVSLSSPDLGRINARIPPGSRTVSEFVCAAKVVRAIPALRPATSSSPSRSTSTRSSAVRATTSPWTSRSRSRRPPSGRPSPCPRSTAARSRSRWLPGTPSGRVLRLKGRGVKRGDHVGDLLAKVQVVVPQRLTDEAREAVEKMAEAEDGHDPRADLFERARA